MATGQQLRLLLWKDYLIRKRNPVTLAGIAWATMVMMCLYAVRINVDNQDFPTCQFPARALPSAGMVTFLQSFICSVNNECEPMDRFQEIPTYENSKLTQLQRRFSPLLHNETVLEVAESVPNALRLLASLATVLDHPTMLEISKNGLQVSSLFRNPAQVRRYLRHTLGISGDAASSVMHAKISLTGLFDGNFDRCRADSISKLLLIEDSEDLDTFVEKLCQLTDNEFQKFTKDLLMEIDYSKYIRMAAVMYRKLTGDEGVEKLADLTEAVLRLARADSFLPPAVAKLVLDTERHFSYFDVNIITKLLDQFEPTFGRTATYANIRSFADMLTTALQYLDTLAASTDDDDDTRDATGLVTGLVAKGLGDGEENFKKLFNNAVDMLEKAAKGNTTDIFKIFAQVMNTIHKFLSDDKKHDVLFYSTLLAKLIEGATKVVTINLNIQEMAYDASLRHPAGVKVLLSLPVWAVRKGFEGLADAERVQIVTSKLNVRGQIFCDSNKLASFFKVSKNEGDSLKKILCNDQWKDYMADLLTSFGIFDVKDIINYMASLVVQETFGKDTSSQLYSIEQDWAVVQNFTQTLLKMRAEPKTVVDWNKLFNVTEDSEFMQVFKGKERFGKQILITVHGALAKEVVKQNAILDYKISPILVDFTTLVTAVKDQLYATPGNVTNVVKTQYPAIVMSMLNTLLDEQKTYKALSTPSEAVVCSGASVAAAYLALPEDSEDLVSALCGASRAIEDGLGGDSEFAKAIAKVKNSSHGLTDVNWTALIDGLKQVYLKLDADYPYLFEFTSYGMSREEQQKVKKLMDDAKEYWFSAKRMNRSLHLSMKLLFRLLDVTDSPSLGLSTEGWLRLKHAVHSAVQPLAVIDDFLKLITAVSRNKTYSPRLPPLTAAALQALVPNIPPLIADTVDNIVRGELDLEAITSLLNGDPAWPCGDSISSTLPLTEPSQDAVLAIEDMLCLDSGLREEWQEFILERNLTLYNASTWNTTTFSPHVFLNFSRVFDGLVEDTMLVKELMMDLVKGEGRLSLAGAWKYAASLFDGSDRNDTLRKLFSNMDVVLDSISSAPQALSPSGLWERYARCRGDCHSWLRAAARATLRALGVALRDAAGDLLTYFTEINEPSASILQYAGFTRGTGLSVLVHRLPEFVAALLNSYWDYGFMSQIRRAALTEFWDCNAVVSSLSPAASAALDDFTIKRVSPFLCPSLLHWLSLPRDENAFLDIVAKPQYTFYNLPAQNLTSSFEAAFNKTLELARLLTSLQNNTETKDQNTKPTSLQDKLQETVDTVLNYRINASDPSYIQFHETNKKQFMSAVYLTRIVAMVNKIAVAIENLNPLEINSQFSEEEVNKLTSDISTFNKIFQRRPNEAIAFHFDVITSLLSSPDDNLDLVKAVDEMCEDFKNEDLSKDILTESARTKNQICSKEYKVIYGAVQNVLDEDYGGAKASLLNLVSELQDGDDDVRDIVQFFKDRKKLTNSLKSSIKYAYELGLPVYLRYLQGNLQGYVVVLELLSGGDWWQALRAAYGGPLATAFFDAAEKAFDIVEDLLTKPDEIHLVRLLRDIDVNNSMLFCSENASLSEYVPDAGGALSRLRTAACAATSSDVFRQLPPLVIASQGYDNDLQLPKDINYTSLYVDISTTESLLDSIKAGPVPPSRPGWVTDEKITKLRQAAVGLLSRETLTKVAFGVLGNVVDGATLFLNNSECTACSQLTSWVKQLNLQLYKKQEYDALLCLVSSTSDTRLHHTLTADFHWDMAYRELISFRNYTLYELNKSLNELLGQVKLHLLEDAAGTRTHTKPADCLLPGDQPSLLGDAALFLKVLSRTLKLIRSELPHLHEVEGLEKVPFFQDLSARVTLGLDAFRPLTEYVMNSSKLRDELMKELPEDVTNSLMESYLNLRAVGHVGDRKLVDKYIKASPDTGYWTRWICDSHDCSKIAAIIDRYVNMTRVKEDLPAQQKAAFWRFESLRRLLRVTENIAESAARLLREAGRMDAPAVIRGDLAAVIDFLLEITTGDTADTIYYSIRDILGELSPLLEGSSLQRDLYALTDGLRHLQDYRQQLAKEDIKVSVRDLFVEGDSLESSLSALGINNTNFWSLAAPHIHDGFILLKPILNWKSGDHISNYVCDASYFWQVVQVGELGQISRDDISSAVHEQLCNVTDPGRILPPLLRHLNRTYVITQVSSFLLEKLYSAANITSEEGTAVTNNLPRMAAVLPSVQAQLGEATDALREDPLFKSLANFSSVGGLIGSSDFLARAGEMMCGRKFTADVPRLFRSVLTADDYAQPKEDMHAGGLPTEFCRSLYQDIMRMEGGKIVWSFVKPLIMGRVLYTPPHPLVHNIIQRANSSFAHMSRLASLVHSFAASFPSLDVVSSHRAGVSVLRRMLTSPGFDELRTTLLSDAPMPELDLDDVFDEFGELSGVGSLLSKVSELLRCINLDRFHPAPSEDELAHSAAALTATNEFTAGLVFLNNEEQDLSPFNMHYKIRMDIDNVPTTSRMKNYFWIPGPESNFLENMRYFRGFVQLQDMVDRAIIAEAASQAGPRAKREDAEEDQWTVYTQQMPYPCYRKDFFQTSLYESQALIVAFFFSLLFSVAAAVRFIVADHDKGNAMLLQVMGVRGWRLTLSWFLWAALEMLLTVSCACAVLCAGGVLPRSAPSLVFTLMVIFGFSVLCFCYMMSKLFSKASFAAVCSAIAYLVTFMPFVLILSLEAVISRLAKTVICLSMSSSLCYAFLHVTRLEATGSGAQWSGLWDTSDPEDLSIGVACLMMLVDCALYVAVGWAIDRCCGLRKVQSSITYSPSSAEKAGVSVMSVSKTYGKKQALNDVSLELQHGQLTTLLGHNGAGKTTLIKILSGMLRPTSGRVIIRCVDDSPPGDSSRGDMYGVRRGVCPQQSVLFEHMTPREHVTLYTKIKTGQDDVGQEVDRLLRVLSLGPSADIPVSSLSGGTRRRVCVCLAFAGAPALVTLDEPTAGVDPTARREIWSMIEKLKEGCTILMTTHHLDEAELLSDQIVILHKGEVHTVGTPIDIKRSLGTGYTLSVTFPPDCDPAEKCKEVLGAVRSLVRTAGLRDVCGTTVELSLPYYCDTLSNDFLGVCTMLESQQATLGFEHYSLDSSSLEHVFHSLCSETEQPEPIQYDPLGDSPSKSTSSSSIRTEGPLVSGAGPRTGTVLQQLQALLLARYIHYTRNRWLLFVMLVLPSLFVCIAMAFSTIRPPADNEISLLLHRNLYPNTTQFIISEPSVYSDQVEPSFARRVMEQLMSGTSLNWTSEDTPSCQCSDAMQVCNLTTARHADLMLVPDVATLNEWLVNTQQLYREKRYFGYSSTLSNNVTGLVAWYNNKGHHSLPAALSSAHTAALRAVTGRTTASIHTYTHPMKISPQQISKDTVYQHVADAGISGLLVISFALVSAASALPLVSGRVRQDKRLQLLSGVSPLLYSTAALVADLCVIVVNIVITAILMEAFHFPVFVERNNLPAICLLILLYGLSCGCLVHVAEKLFSDASVANMLLFCGNAFLGLGPITVLLILDVISDSERTDVARWWLHKVFLAAPQFALGDGLLELAKNTIQAQVLSRFGMDTYRDPLSSSLLRLHFTSLALTSVALFALNQAIEYQLFDSLLYKLWPETVPAGTEEEEEDVREERRRVLSQEEGAPPLRLHTIGNINAGFVETEGKTLTPTRLVPLVGDVAAAVGVGKVYRTRGVARVALRDLTLGLPPGQCTVLLGANGAGKSTTFSILTAQTRPSAGRLRLAGAAAAGPRLCNGLISYCPQTDAVDPLLTVRETLDIYCRLRGIADRDEVVHRTMAAMELLRYSGTLAGDLSGGNRRKLCCALAFMSRAPLVLLDEPTSGMDPGSVGCVRRGVSAAGGCARAVLVSTHQWAEARALAARVALLRQGRLVALAPLHHCLARYGGGSVVQCSVRPGAGRAAWRSLQALAPHAQLHVLHRNALHFLLPTTTTVEGKEVQTRLSDVFRLLARLQAAGDVRDYTLNQSSLEQMFLSFNGEGGEGSPHPAPLHDELTSVTSL